MALTAQQMMDVRRFAGYQVAGTTMSITEDQDIAYLQFGTVEMSLYKRLTSLSSVEETQVGTYLTTLNQLEADVTGSRTNLDTDKAAVWTHNKDEVRDRVALFDMWRRRLCGFLGLPYGPGLSSGALAISRA